jgi:cytochrome c553
MILHDVSSREGLCLICHGEQATDQLKFPDNHIGLTADECLSCHEAAEDRVIITWGELGESGQRTFLSNCAPCHGDDGSGGSEAPANIGPELAAFTTAQRLFNFISANAPMDLPGGLSELKYQQILAFMLIESNLIQSEAVFDEGNLANISLK